MSKPGQVPGGSGALRLYLTWPWQYGDQSVKLQEYCGKTHHIFYSLTQATTNKSLPIIIYMNSNSPFWAIHIILLPTSVHFCIQLGSPQLDLGCFLRKATGQASKCRCGHKDCVLPRIQRYDTYHDTRVTLRYIVIYCDTVNNVIYCHFLSEN